MSRHARGSSNIFFWKDEFCQHPLETSLGPKAACILYGLEKKLILIMGKITSISFLKIGNVIVA